MYRYISFQLFLALCMVFSANAAEERNDPINQLNKSTANIVSGPMILSVKNSSESELFVVLADGERFQASNAKTKSSDKKCAPPYKTVLFHEGFIPLGKPRFFDIKRPSQLTLYLWENPRYPSYFIDIYKQLGVPVVKKRFELTAPTAIFRFSPGDYKGLHLEWNGEQLLPFFPPEKKTWSLRKKSAINGFVFKNIHEDQIRRIH